MWPSSYEKRVASDLESWVEQGWVSADNTPDILASLNKEDAPSKLPVVITVLGAVLIGFSAMAFVAANWADMSKGLRLGILGLAMWSAYGAAAFLHMRNQVAFTEAAFVVGVALFGANIMLIGQMYHLPQDFPAGLLVWSLGGLVTAWTVQSRAALAATQLLLMGWTAAEGVQTGLHFTYFIPWAAAAYLGIRLKWLPAYHLALVSIFIWMYFNVGGLAEAVGWDNVLFPFGIVSFFILLWFAGLALTKQGHSFGRAIEVYAALTTVLLLLVFHIFDDGFRSSAQWVGPVLIVGGAIVVASFIMRKLGAVRLVDSAALSSAPLITLLSAYLGEQNISYSLWLVAPLLLIFCVWLVTFGTDRQNRFLINLGFAAFGGEALYLYLVTFGTLLDTAAFFAVGGVLLIAGGFVWERLRRRATATQSEATS